MPKKNIGFNASDEEEEQFIKARDAAGFSSNADFIKSRCLSLDPIIRGKEEEEIELETPEEKRIRLRISNVITRALPISSLNMEELKRYVLVMDAILKTHKVESLTSGRVREAVQGFEPKYTVIRDMPALPDQRESVIHCLEPSCDAQWRADFRQTRRDHMIRMHGWTMDQLVGIGDL